MKTLPLQQALEVTSAAPDPATATFAFPTHEEMAASLDAEMARLGITPPVADTWGAAA